jgi:hypothetical protein
MVSSAVTLHRLSWRPVRLPAEGLLRLLLRLVLLLLLLLLVLLLQASFYHCSSAGQPSCGILHSNNSGSGDSRVAQGSANTLTLTEQHGKCQCMLSNELQTHTQRRWHRCIFSYAWTCLHPMLV